MTEKVKDMRSEPVEDRKRTARALRQAQGPSTSAVDARSARAT